MLLYFCCARGCSERHPRRLTPYAKLLHLRVAMRDNVRLDTNVFYPAASGRFPTVLLRTPYGKGGDLPAGYQSFIHHGYAVVMQDVRGRYARPACLTF